MISVEEALHRIRQHAHPLMPVPVSLSKASGLVLAEDVYASVSIPVFHQAAMDGYAFRYEDYLQGREFVISGEVAAGDSASKPVKTNEAVRIFTGAPLPPAADTVVMQEKTEVSGRRLFVQDNQLQQWSNVRTVGSEINSNEVALQIHTFLTPAAIGFLAATGCTEVIVYPKPKVSIIVTGKELQQPGKPLQPGQVYECNSIMLKTALEQLHIHDITISFTGDDPQEIQTALKHAMTQADLVLLTGGVSVGSYDFVVEAAKVCGVQQLFHKIAQRPGKPLYAGIKDDKIIFGLPGNPASVLTCFYVYVLTAIEQLTVRKNLLEKRWLPLAVSYTKKIQLTQFLKAVCNEKKVTPLTAQESFRLSSFSLANCLMVLPAEKLSFAEGELVETFVLPYL